MIEFNSKKVDMCKVYFKKISKKSD